MSQEHRRRTRRAQQRVWDQEIPDQPPFDTPEPSAPSPEQKDAVPAAEENDWEDPISAEPPQEENAPSSPLSRENLILLCIIGTALVVAAVFGFLLLRQGNEASSGTNVAATAVPYDVTQPFMASDITEEQMRLIEQNGGSFALMDYQTGPHGIKIGDSLDTLLERFPITYTQTIEDDFTWDEAAQNMSYLTYDFLETDFQVIYAQRVFYQEGEMVVLPPSGTLSVSSDTILVTLIAPLTPYPEGTAENYLSYPHVYCKLTVDPNQGKITRIVLGKSE